MNNTLFAKLSWCLLVVCLIAVLMQRSSAQAPTQPAIQIPRFQPVSVGNCEDASKCEVFRINTATGETVVRLDNQIDDAGPAGKKQLVRYDYWEKVTETPSGYDFGKVLDNISKSIP
jgi:hypothetical protein